MGVRDLTKHARLAGNADLGASREINPELKTLKSWLNGSGEPEFENALGAGGNWEFTGNWSVCASER
ncbi:hypothetical protein CN231_16560 [Sinorhizobium meliloti]|nr:hypothetical protein CN231_16560 [Sinorhizobium meliloti]